MRSSLSTVEALRRKVQSLKQSIEDATKERDEELRRNQQKEAERSRQSQLNPENPQSLISLQLSTIKEIQETATYQICLFNTAAFNLSLKNLKKMDQQTLSQGQELQGRIQEEELEHQRLQEKEIESKKLQEKEFEIQRRIEEETTIRRKQEEESTIRRRQEEEIKMRRKQEEENQIKKRQEEEIKMRRRIEEELTKKLIEKEQLEYFLWQQKNCLKMHPNSYVIENLKALEGKYYECVQKRRLPLKNNYSHISEYGYQLNHRSVLVDFSKFLRYDWSNLLEISMMECQLHDPQFQELVDNAGSYPFLERLYLSNNFICIVTNSQLQQFENLRLLHLGETQSNRNQQITKETVQHLKNYRRVGRARILCYQLQNSL